MVRKYRVRDGVVDWSVEANGGGAQTPEEIRLRVERALRLGFRIRNIEPKWATWSVENDAAIVYLTMDGGQHTVAKEGAVA